MSFIEDKIQFEGLTFGDIILTSSYSELFPRDIDLSLKLTPNNSDSENKMAISIACEGGICIFHKNMSNKRQALQETIEERAATGYRDTGNRKAQQQATFFQTSNAGVSKSLPIDTSITQEATNYSIVQ